MSFFASASNRFQNAWSQLTTSNSVPASGPKSKSRPEPESSEGLVRVGQIIDRAVLDEPPPESAGTPDPGLETAIRSLTFWKNGFSVGPTFFDYEIQENVEYLNELNSGRAPPALLDVQPNQLVELVIHKRVDEMYVPADAEKLAPPPMSGLRPRNPYDAAET